MVLQQFFLSPLGLAALAVAVPLVLLYLIRPDPSRVELPTFRFLTEEERQQSTTPLLEQLSRSLLLLLQLLIILLIAVSLATPYVPVSEREAVTETVLVVDTSASMATAADGDTRFDRALSEADAEVTQRTSVVTTVGRGTVALRRGSPSDARETLGGLRVSDAPGDLRSAIAQAGTIVGEDARVVVLSDFAGEGWTDAVATLRARGISVDLRQFDRGGETNVGFVDRRFSGAEVTLSVKNFGDSPVTRTVSLGDSQREVDLGAGDVATVTVPVPAGTSRAQLSPGDSFATDDTAYLAAPSDPTVDVLVVTNDRNRFLTTAFEVNDQVDLTVETPPGAIEGEFDVVVYSNVEPDSLLPGNVETGRDVLADGGGVAIQAQESFPEEYGDLLLLEPAGLSQAATIQQTAETDLTRGISFQAPDEYVAGTLRSGEALVALRDGTPLIATASRGEGRVLYYGYIEESSSFKFNAQYPVFWKRAAFFLADRKPLTALNRETGDTLRFDAETIEGPAGQLSGSRTELADAGIYATGTRRRSASLLSERESDVGVAPISDRGDEVGAVVTEEERTVPRPLTEFVVVGALLFVVAELGYLRRRGDL
ncbi:MAG: hypothetical protein BRD23_09045 [Halobacteriales archaeon SW_9_67_25]|nr:MAG: hypothetical protein BRD23_09045 [Halobacteriales archaeon SW_9_67_25]